MSAWRSLHLAALAAIALSLPDRGHAQAAPARNVVLVVTDGLRWQEVFSGAERALIGPAGGVADTTALLAEFWRASAEARREALLPFVWETVDREGVIVGNRNRNSLATITNGYKFSYPGYNELLTGRADPRLNSNSYGPNPNLTVFEWLARQAAYRGKVAAFATWGVLDDIFNRARSGVDVRTGWRSPFPSPQSEPQRVLDALYRSTVRLWPDNALDALMHQSVLEYVRTAKPRVLFVGYGETDEWAHAGRYDLTLRSAHQVDAFIAELWRTMQEMPEYRGATTFIITTDHGRGDGPVAWQRHGESVVGAEHIWMALLGPGVEARGELDGPVSVTQAQVAATVAALLGEDWVAASPSAAQALPFVSRPGKR